MLQRIWNQWQKNKFLPRSLSRVLKKKVSKNNVANRQSKVISRTILQTATENVVTAIIANEIKLCDCAMLLRSVHREKNKTLDQSSKHRVQKVPFGVRKLSNPFKILRKTISSHYHMNIDMLHHATFSFLPWSDRIPLSIKLCFRQEGKALNSI